MPRKLLDKPGWVINPASGRFVKIKNALKYGIHLNTHDTIEVEVVADDAFNMDAVYWLIFKSCDLATKRKMLMSAKSIIRSIPAKDKEELLSTAMFHHVLWEYEKNYQLTLGSLPHIHAKRKKTMCAARFSLPKTDV